MGSRTYAFDAFMQLADGANAVTAAGFTQVGGIAKILDLGGAPNRSDLGIVGGYARIDAALVVDVSALNVANANNDYRLVLLGSNNANMSAPVVLGELELGNGAALPNGVAGLASTGAGSTSFPGRYEMLFATEQADINYEFVALWVVPAGTAPSITFTAFVAVLPMQ
jgi:hypothetical protein